MPFFSYNSTYYLRLTFVLHIMIYHWQNFLCKCEFKIGFLSFLLFTKCYVPLKLQYSFEIFSQQNALSCFKI